MDKVEASDVFEQVVAYWADSGSSNACTVATVSVTTYGYVQSSRVSVASGGIETAFSATGQHLDSTRTFTMDLNGSIS